MTTRTLPETSRVVPFISSRLVHDEHVSIAVAMDDCEYLHRKSQVYKAVEVAHLLIETAGRRRNETITIAAGRPNSPRHLPRLYVFDKFAWQALTTEGYSLANIITKALGRVAMTSMGDESICIDAAGNLTFDSCQLAGTTTVSIDHESIVMICEKSENGRLLTANWAGSIVLPHQHGPATGINYSGLYLVANKNA